MPVTEINEIKKYYQALLTKDQSYVGIFYAGVKTTSIFCIATCRAKKPKLENTEFFYTVKEALNAGYRPCKICRPTENANEAPEQIINAIKMITQNPKIKISDSVLREHEISPEIVRRWFKKNYGITFQAYQRMYRINQAYQELKTGKKIIDVAFDNGYGSLSGFGYIYKKIAKNSPSGHLNNNIILINRLTTPIGPMFVCATQQGVCLLEFVDRRMLETEFKQLQQLLNATIIFGENEHIIQTRIQIKEYFEGKRKYFSIPLHTPGTDFQQAVWNCLKQIPYGELTTYKQQAEKMHNPQAVRAVANANGFNRIAIIIPCHRVIGSNGKLTGYGGGLERKKWLIDHEKSNLKS